MLRRELHQAPARHISQSDAWLELESVQLSSFPAFRRVPKVQSRRAQLADSKARQCCGGDAKIWIFLLLEVGMPDLWHSCVLAAARVPCSLFLAVAALDKSEAAKHGNRSCVRSKPQATHAGWQVISAEHPLKMSGLRLGHQGRRQRSCLCLAPPRQLHFRGEDPQKP